MKHHQRGALLGAARAQAGDGSRERIAIGRVYYLGGMKTEGQAIFDQVLAEKHKPSDELRIGRVYREAGVSTAKRASGEGQASVRPLSR